MVIKLKVTAGAIYDGKRINWTLFDQCGYAPSSEDMIDSVLGRDELAWSLLWGPESFMELVQSTFGMSAYVYAELSSSQSWKVCIVDPEIGLEHGPLYEISEYWTYAYKWTPLPASWVRVMVKGKG